MVEVSFKGEKEATERGSFFRKLVFEEGASLWGDHPIELFSDSHLRSGSEGKFSFFLYAIRCFFRVQGYRYHEVSK